MSEWVSEATYEWWISDWEMITLLGNKVNISYDWIMDIDNNLRV